MKMDIKIKDENFKRIAFRRLKAVFNKIESLANCSNKRYYSYDKELIENLRKVINNNLDEQFKRFDHPYRNKKA